jgi:hypothetical protein
MGLMSFSIIKVFLSSHPHFNSGNLGLPKSFRIRISVIKVLPAFLGPKKINNEAT